MSFPVLALAAAAATEVCRYTGVKPSFLDGIDVVASHHDPDTGRPVFTVRATSFLFGYLETANDGTPVGIHDHGLSGGPR